MLFKTTNKKYMMNKTILKTIAISLLSLFIYTKSNAQCIDLVKDKGFTY